MTKDERHRRAIATGLAPYLDERLIPEAVLLWQSEYAGRPRFSLQGYLSELCRLFDLAERRHDIHLSLVQAMTLPEAALLPDPVARINPAGGGHPCTEAFEAMMRALWQRLDNGAASRLRLDQLTALRHAGLDRDSRAALEGWLGNPRGRLAPLPRPALRAALNGTYMLFCEELGPVAADRLFKQAGDGVRRDAPALAGGLNALL